MKATTLFYIVFMLCVVAAVGVIIWWFGYNQSSPPTPSPTPVSPITSFLGSAARGDFLTIEIQDNVVTYNNLTNKTLSSDLFSTDEAGYLSFPSTTNVGLLKWNTGIMLHMSDVGPTQSEKALVLGLLTSPFDSPVFPAKMYNYMRFYTNNNGFEVGYIDTRNASAVKQQYCSPALSRYTASGNPGTGNIVDGVQTLSDFAIDPRNYDLSDDGMYLSKQAEAITIFKSEDDELVMDINQGSIFAFPEQADDTRPTGTYQGLLYGKNDARIDETNTETGDDMLTRVTLTFSDDTFTWIDGSDTFTGTISPFHDIVSMNNQSMHGLFYSRVVGENDALIDFCFIKGENGKLLCAYFNQTLEVLLPISPPPPRGPRTAYQYRHGAAFFRG